jgi:hypothetical protein
MILVKEAWYKTGSKEVLKPADVSNFWKYAIT